jgi:hypothetical protein
MIADGALPNRGGNTPLNRHTSILHMLAPHFCTAEK